MGGGRPLFSSHDRHIGSVGSEVKSCRSELTGCVPVSSQITAIFSASGVYNFPPHVAIFYLYTPCNFPIPSLSLSLAFSLKPFLGLSLCYLFPHFCPLHSPFQLSPCLDIGVNEKGGVYLFFMTARACRWIKQGNRSLILTFSFGTWLTGEGHFIHMHCSCFPHTSTDIDQIMSGTESSVIGGERKYEAVCRP